MQTGLSYFRENLRKLPLDVREAIVDTDYLGAMEEIQKDLKLHIDQAAGMEELTFKLMLGEVDQRTYTDQIGKKLHVDPSVVSEIIKQVDEKIMKPIKDRLQDIQDQELLDEDAEHPMGENLTKADSKEILEGIENPEPSVAIPHEVQIPVIQKKTNNDSNIPTNPTVTPVTRNNPAAIVPSANQQTPVPVGWPAPAQQPTQTTASQTPPPPTQQNQPQTTIAPNPTAAANLAQKLEQPTISKPAEIKYNLDPYKEPLE